MTTSTERKGIQLTRSLKSRHIFMLSLGGVIGTGLFMGSGVTINQGGPWGAILSYLVAGFLMYLVMVCLGELSVQMPVSGSFQAHATKYIGPATGFMIGWVYWMSWATTVGLEFTAAGGGELQAHGGGPAHPVDPADHEAGGRADVLGGVGLERAGHRHLHRQLAQADHYQVHQEAGHQVGEDRPPGPALVDGDPGAHEQPGADHTAQGQHENVPALQRARQLDAFAFSTGRHGAPQQSVRRRARGDGTGRGVQAACRPFIIIISNKLRRPRRARLGRLLESHVSSG